MDTKDNNPAISGLNNSLVSAPEDIEYIYRIRCHYSSLTKKQKKIADYICKHQDEALHHSINQLAERIGTNAPTITRFSQALGFKGFSELKFYMQQGILSPFAKTEYAETQDSLSMIKQKMITQNREIVEDTITLLDERSLEKTIRLCASAPRLDIFAEGGSASSASAAYNMFLQLGLPCRLYTDAFLGITSASQLKRGDVVLAVSYSGSAISTVNFLKAAKGKKATTIAITGYVNSPLTNYADIVLYTSTKVKNDLRDMHVARISELCVIGLIQVGIYVKTADKMVDNIKSLMEATHLTRLKNGYNVLF